MRIGLMLHPVGEKEAGGLGRFVYMLAKTLVEAYPEHHFILFSKKPLPSGMCFNAKNWENVSRGGGFLWIDRVLFSGPRTDVTIFFTPMMPLFFRPRRSIVFALDFAYLAFAGTPREWIRAKLLFLLHAITLWKATNIVAISEETKQNAMRYFRLPSSKITVAHIGYFPFSGERTPMEIPRPFFLFAGVLKARKNVAGVIRAFARFHPSHPDFSLLIAGKRSGAYYESLVTLARALGAHDSVRFLGYVTDEELAYLYTEATGLVFPSFVEGFGMPVLEAMHLGAPVITSQTGALAEVAGDAALLVDPHDPDHIARAMSALADDAPLRESLRVKGRARSKQFSWAAAAVRLIEIARGLYKG